MIKDLSNHAQTLEDWNYNIPWIRAKCKELGVKLNEQIFVNPEEAHSIALSCKSKLAEKYYGTNDVEKIFDIVNSDSPIGNVNEDHREFYLNWRRARTNQLSENSVALTCKWGVNYDPVSKLIILIRIAIDADNEVFDCTTESKVWLHHNMEYIPKIGFTSQYYPPVLAEANKAYGRTGSVKLTDEQIEALVMAAKIQQDAIIDLSCKRMDLAKTHADATEKNNKAAESFPGFRNQKHEDVKQQVLEDAQWVEDNCDENDTQFYNEQHRIQSGGNVVLLYSNVKMDENTGKVEYTFEGLVAAVNQIANERGYFICYYEDEPIILPELAGVIHYRSLPASLSERKIMVDTGEAPEIILRRFSDINDWQYQYALECPNVFTLVGDKFPDLVDFTDKIYTKHRSVKASSATSSRLGQTFLYPFMAAAKDKLMKGFSPKYSMVAQWTHPDNLKQLFTDALVSSVPSIYKDLKMSTTYNEKQLEEFRKWIDEHHLTTWTSSDDKTGFDTLTKMYMTWLYFCAFLSIPFEMSDENIKLFRMLSVGISYPVVFAINGIEIYSEIIASGAWCTSHLGTYCSNLQTIAMRFHLAGALDIDGVNVLAVEETGQNDENGDKHIIQVGDTDISDSPAESENAEE